MNKMKLRKIVIIFMMLLVIGNIFQSGVYAFSLSEIFNRGNGITGSSSDYSEVESLVGNIGTSIVKPIGYLIFAIVTVVLGVQYIWSGYNGKSKVKETLPVFICAVVLFYLGDKVTDLFTGIFDDNIGSVEQLTGNIWVNVCNVVQILAFTGILFIGVKYLMENSEGRAKIKERLAPMLIGIVFVFCAANVVSAIVKIGDTLV